MQEDKRRLQNKEQDKKKKERIEIEKRRQEHIKYYRQFNNREGEIKKDDKGQEYKGKSRRMKKKR